MPTLNVVHVGATNKRALEQQQLVCLISRRSAVQVRYAHPTRSPMLPLNEPDEAVLNGTIGRTLTGWQQCEGGMHFVLDDGRVLMVVGKFVIAVFKPELGSVH